MPVDATQVRVASDGKVLVAPVGTALPTDTTTAWNVAFLDLGFASEDGISITPSLDTEDIMGWQSAYPLRRVVTGSGLEIAFTCMQANPDTLALFFNGTVASGSLPVPVSPSVQERARGIEWSDGATKWRLVVPRAVLSDKGEMTLARGEATAIELTFTALPPSSGTSIATVIGVV